MRSYEHFFKNVAIGRPWALMPEKFEELRTILEARLAGQPGTWDGETNAPGAVTYYEAAAGDGSASGAGQVAVIPLYGVMMPKVSPMAAMSGASSTQGFRKALADQVNNPQVKTIVIDVDSPGGSVFGVEELAGEVRRAATRKSVVAVANEGLMASAAYYAMSGASEIVASPSSELGSIGVLAIHYDFSAQNEMEGIKATLIKAGKYKAEGAKDFPLSEEALAHVQEDVNRYYEMFLRAVSIGRGVSVQAVRNGFGEGRVVGAQEAVRLGMADRVATLEETIARFAGGGRPSKRASAETIIVETAEAEPVTVASEEDAELPPPPAASADDEAAARDRDLLALDLDLLTPAR